MSGVDHHTHPGEALGDAFENPFAGDVGEIQVQDDRVVLDGLVRGDGLVARGDPIDNVPELLQQPLGRPTEAQVVVHEEQAARPRRRVNVVLGLIGERRAQGDHVLIRVAMNLVGEREDLRDDGSGSPDGEGQVPNGLLNLG